MPATTDHLADKPTFDVYAAMTLVTFAFMLCATLLLNDDLDKNWNFWAEEGSAVTKRATHLTDPFDGDPTSTVFKVSDVDLDEWKIINNNQPFPVSGFEWPEGYDPKANQVKADVDNLAIPEAARQKLLAGYTGNVAPESEKVQDAPAPKKE